MPSGMPHHTASPAEMALFPEMNPGPVIRTDLHGEILLVNAAARAVFAPAAMIGARWTDVCADADPLVWARAIAGEDMLQHESAVGERTFVFTYRRPREIASVFIYGSDITQRKRAEQQVAEVARFPDMNPGPVLRVDREATIKLANRAAREVLGDGALPGRCWRDVCPALDDATWARILGTTQVVPIEMQLGDRSFVFAHRRTDNGDLVFVFGNDVTALRSAEQALLQAEKMATLGTLAAGVAHELNNPAAAATRAAGHLRDAFAALQDAFVAVARAGLPPDRIEALLAVQRTERERAARVAMIDPLTRSDLETAVEEWLEEHDVGEPWALAGALVSMGYDTTELDRLGAAWGEHLGVVAGWLGRAQPVLALSREIEEATRRISSIVQSLKSYSYVGQAPVGKVDVREGIESTLVMLRAKLRNVHVEREYANDLPLIDAHGSELNQVWTNLLDNAAQALGESGRIVIRARRADDALVVEIEDDGPGIPAGAQQKVFDPFFTTKAPGQGTGLGLSTTRNIIERKHGGSIALASRAGCTRFTIRLPLHAVTPPIPAPSNPAA